MSGYSRTEIDGIKKCTLGLAIDQVVGEPSIPCHLVEFGSGYGTFTLLVAEPMSGLVKTVNIYADIIAFAKVRSLYNLIFSTTFSYELVIAAFVLGDPMR